MSFWTGESGEKHDENVDAESQRGKVFQVYVTLKKKGGMLIIFVSVPYGGCR